MSCIRCKNFYYCSDSSDCCDMPYKDACLNNNFQFKEKLSCVGSRAKAQVVDDYLVEDENF